MSLGNLQPTGRSAVSHSSPTADTATETNGSDTSYPNVKTMAGISTRMKPDRILEGGQMFGAVDIANWSASLKEAVLLYIEGL